MIVTGLARWFLQIVITHADGDSELALPLDKPPFVYHRRIVEAINARVGYVDPVAPEEQEQAQAQVG